MNSSPLPWHRRQTEASLAAVLLGALALTNARARQITGEPGSPRATTTTGGKHLPFSDAKFGGVASTPALDRIARAKD